MALTVPAQSDGRRPEKTVLISVFGERGSGVRHRTERTRLSAGMARITSSRGCPCKSRVAQPMLAVELSGLNLKKSRPGLPRRPGSTRDHQLRKRSEAGDVPARLPLVHITPVAHAKRIVASRKLEARLCGVFNRKIIYFFAMKAAYRFRDADEKSHQINRFPFVFILRPDAFEVPFHVFPFDTGAADRGMFDAQADPFEYLEDYELDPTHDAVSGHIGWAFGSIEAYLNGDLKPDLLKGIPISETLTRGFVDIARMAGSGSNSPDKRASAIEVACDHNIDLKGNVLHAIIPDRYLESPDCEATRSFTTALNELEISWSTYPWQPSKAPNEFYEDIDRIAREFYRQAGLI